MSRPQASREAVARALRYAPHLAASSTLSYWRWTTSGKPVWTKALASLGLIAVVVSIVLVGVNVANDNGSAGASAAPPPDEAPPPPTRPERTATIVVDNLNDAGPGSLREAILAANADPGPDTITFGPKASPANRYTSGAAGQYTIHLTSDLPAIAGDLKITGGSLKLKGDLNFVTVGIGPSINIRAGSSGFDVEPGGSLSLSGLAISGDAANLIRGEESVKLDLIHISGGLPVRSLAGDGLTPTQEDVTNTNDAGPGSLRAAINAANARAGVTVVAFNPTLTGSIDLLSSLPSIRRDVQIVGPGADSLTIVSHSDTPILSVGPDTIVSIAGLTLKASRGIVNRGDLTLLSTNLVPLTSGDGIAGDFSLRNANQPRNYRAAIYEELPLAGLLVAAAFMLWYRMRSGTARQTNLTLVLAALALAEVAVAAIGLAEISNLFSYPFEMNGPDLVALTYGLGAGRILFGLVIVLLFAFYALAVMVASHVRDGAGVRVALLGTVVLAASFVIVYPTGFRDVFNYMANARTLSVYHQNPLSVPPYAHLDAISRAVTVYGLEPSGYGYLYSFFNVLPSFLGGADLLRSLIAFKAFSAVFLLLLAWLIGREAERQFPGRGAQAVVAVGWNPFILYEAVGSGHNDIIMAALMVAGLTAAARLQFVRSMAFLLAAVLIKYAAAPLIPLALWWWWRKGQTRPVRVASLFLAALGAIGLVLYLPHAGGTINVLKITLVDVDNFWHSLPWLVDWYLRTAFNLHLPNEARIASLVVLAVCGLVVMRRLGQAVSNLYEAAFFLMAALGVMALGSSLPWYSLWFIPMGFLLPGTRFPVAAMIASAGGFFVYVLFPWTGGAFADVFWLTTAWLLPAAYLLRRQARPADAVPASSAAQVSLANST